MHSIHFYTLLPKGSELGVSPKAANTDSGDFFCCCVSSREKICSSLLLLLSMMAVAKVQRDEVLLLSIAQGGTTAL